MSATETQPTNRRPPPPPLEFQPPDCPMCWDTTSVDPDGCLYCESCGAYWSLADYLDVTKEPGPGEWADPSQPQCGHVERPSRAEFTDQPEIRRCVRTLHHHDDHAPMDLPVVEVELPEDMAPCPS